MHRLISGPAISHLTLTHRMTVNDRLRRGYYGPTHRRGQIVYAAVDAVARAEGVDFTDDQIARAVAGQRNRILTISPESTEEVANGTEN